MKICIEFDLINYICHLNRTAPVLGGSERYRPRMFPTVVVSCSWGCRCVWTVEARRGRARPGRHEH